MSDSDYVFDSGCVFVFDNYSRWLRPVHVMDIAEHARKASYVSRFRGSS